MKHKVGSILMDILLAILAIALIGTMFLKLNGYQMRAVLTGSMEPELPVGSLVIAKPIAYEEIKVGDDITYVRDESLTVVTHRVIKIVAEDESVVTQGIANNTPDGEVYYPNILGRVVFCIPLIGYFAIWLSSPIIKITVAVVIALLLLLWILLSGSDDKAGKPVTNTCTGANTERKEGN